MSDIAIHQLPTAGALTVSDNIPIDDGIATVRTTVAALRAGLAYATHAHGMANITGLQTALNAKAPLVSPGFTGTVAVAAGSASAPAIAPSGDLDTGLFFPMANTVALTAGAVQRLRICDDGSFQIRSPAGGKPLFRTGSHGNPSGGQYGRCWVDCL